MGQEEFQELSSFLKRFIRRLKLLEGMEGILLIGICALLFFALGPAILQIKTIVPYAPVIYAGLAVAILLIVIVWTLFRFLRRISQEKAALYIEGKQPKLRNNLINTLQLYPEIAKAKPEFSVPMVLALLRTTRNQVAALNPRDLIETRRLRTSTGLLGILFLPVLGMVLFNPASVGETFSLLSRPMDHLPPRHTNIAIEPNGVRVLRGSPITIHASTTGAIPETLELVMVSRGPSTAAPAIVEKTRMENLGEGKFKATIGSLDKTIRYRAVAGEFASSEHTAVAVDAPEIANVQLTLYPPAYTGLAAVSVPEGNIEGLKGSRVRLDALATKDVIKAELVMDDGKKVPLVANGRRLQANIVLFQPQQYRIEVQDADGFRNAPITYELRVKPDGFPTVELLRPTEDLEINGDEILPIEYGARDDFGIGEIMLVAKIGDREEKIRLQRDGGRKLILREEYKWNLARLGLRDQDEVVFHLQVFDNDTISGPKIGTSKSLRLKLKDFKGEHQQVAQMVQDLNNKMVDLLGDHLERPLPGEKEVNTKDSAPSKFDQNLADAIKRTEEVIKRVEKDRMANFATYSDLEALKRNLQFTQNELLKKEAEAKTAAEQNAARDQIASELERMAMLSEDIGKRMKAQEMSNAAQDLARSQERLMESLDKLQTGDKNLDAIMKQINDLAKNLAALQQSLSQLAQQMPEDFMNAENMRTLGFNEMFSALDEIRKKLQQGDIEGARQLAKELFNQMASMVASLRNQQRNSMMSSMGRMQGEMQRQSNELQEIAREQQEILMETETLNKATLSERDKALKAKLDVFLEMAKRELGQLSELFPDREGRDDPSLLNNLDDATMNQLLKNLIAKLSAKDFEGFAQGNQFIDKEFAKNHSPEQAERVDRTQRSLSNMKQQLAGLMAGPPRALNEGETKRMRDLTHRQSVLKDRTQALHEKLEPLFQLFPSLDPKIVQNIGEAGKEMGQAEGRLGQLDGRGAVPPEQSALERLSQSQQQMQSSMQQMAQRGQLGNFPVTRLFRQGRFMPGGMMVPLPGMPEFPQFEVDQGFTGLDNEKFRLPGKEDYKAPSNFREEIMESLKQGVPPQMKDQIERYFKNLSE